jgi:hypothetical protein
VLVDLSSASRNILSFIVYHLYLSVGKSTNDPTEDRRREAHEECQ